MSLCVCVCVGHTGNCCEELLHSANMEDCSSLTHTYSVLPGATLELYYPHLVTKVKKHGFSLLFFKSSLKFPAERAGY